MCVRGFWVPWTGAATRRGGEQKAFTTRPEVVYDVSGDVIGTPAAAGRQVANVSQETVGVRKTTRKLLSKLRWCKIPVRRCVVALATASLTALLLPAKRKLCSNDGALREKVRVVTWTLIYIHFDIEERFRWLKSAVTLIKHFLPLNGFLKFWHQAFWRVGGRVDGSRCCVKCFLLSRSKVGLLSSLPRSAT